MDAIELPIRPTFDPTAIDKAIAQFKELEAKGFTIPINFVGNLETIKADAEALIAKLRGQWQGLASDLSQGNNKLLLELDRLGESTAAARLRAGFVSVQEEVLVLDNLISELNLKGNPGAGLAKGLAGGRIADLAKSGQAAGDTVSFAGYGESAEKATAAQAKFVAAETKVSQTAVQSEAALASESAALKAKALQFESARAASQKFQVAEEQQAVQAQKSAGLIRQSKEDKRAETSGGLKGILSTVGTAGTFIATYGAIDLAVRALKAGAEASVEFERKMATLQIVFRGSKEEANALGLAVLDQAAALGQDGIKALEVATDFARYGLTQTEVLEAVRVSLIAANVAQLDIAQSGKFLQAIFSGYQLNVGQLSGVLGSLDTISHSYNVTNLQLLEGLSRVAPLAKQAGIGLNELAGFEAVISGRTSRPGSEAGNALKALIARLAKPAVQGTLEEVGVNVKDQSGELKSASQIINELFVSYQNLSSAEKEELLIKLAGTQQASRIAALLDGYLTSQTLAVAASRDLGRAERENIAVRATLSSQLGTLKTEWEKFWVAGSGAGQGGIQGAVTDIVKLMSNLLSVLTLVETGLGKVSDAADRGLKVVLGQTAGGIVSGAASDILHPVRAINKDLEQAGDAAKELFGDAWKTDAEKASDALIKFNAEVEKLQKLGEADEAAGRLVKTVAQLANTAPTEKLEAMFRAVATVSAPGDLREQETIRAQLNGLVKSGDYIGLNNRLTELGVGLEADRVKQLAAANGKLDEAIAGETNHLALLHQQRDVAAGKNDKSAAETKDKEIEQAEVALESLRSRQSGNYAKQFAEGEDPWKAAGVDLEAAKKSATDLVKILMERPKSTHLAELDKETAAARLLAETEIGAVLSANAAGKVSAEMAKQAVTEIEKERDATLKLIESRSKYALIIDTQETAQRGIKDTVEAFGEVVKAVPSLNRTDELTSERQLIDIKDQLLQLEKARELPMLQRLGLSEQEIAAAMANIDAQRKVLQIERDKVAEQLRFAAAVEAAKQGVKNAQAVTGLYDVGKNETEKIENRIAGLSGKFGVDPSKFETKLSEQQEEEFKKWKEKFAPKDSGADYDFRGAFQAGLSPAENGHWPDTFKKPNHETFSDESIYAKKRPDLAGSWTGEKFNAPGRDPVTGLPLNATAAQADLASASNPVEQAQALARLKEFGISLQNAENDLVRRRFQIEAEITNERRKQAEEASKNLLMADRETQLRAALAAKFAADRGGKGFSANEFMFLDQKTKQSIEKTNPELLPPELKNKLHELQDESAGLAAAFKPLKEAADAAAKAIANLHLPTPALNPGGPGGVPVGIDLAPVSSAIDSSGHGVQTAIEVLGTKMSGHLDAFAAGLESISAGLDFRISRLESGSATSRIGRAQGAASVLA